MTSLAPTASTVGGQSAFTGIGFGAGYARIYVNSPSGIERYGYIHRTLYSPDADTPDKAKQEALLWLAQIGRTLRTLTITVDGIPFLKRGDSMQLSIPEIGVQQLVWVTGVTHNVAAGASYTMDVTVTFDDPFVDHKSAAILNKLADTASAQAHLPPAAPAKKAPKPKKAQQRAARVGGGLAGRASR